MACSLCFVTHGCQQYHNAKPEGVPAARGTWQTRVTLSSGSMQLIVLVLQKGAAAKCTVTPGFDNSQPVQACMRQPGLPCLLQQRATSMDSNIKGQAMYYYCVLR